MVSADTHSPARVAIVAQWFPTVSETFILNQITGLIDLGYEVDIYAWGPEGLEEYRHRQLNVYQLADVTTYLPKKLDQEMLVRRFLDRDYCAVHCHFGFVSEKVAFLKRRLVNVPFLVTFHGKDIRIALEEGRHIVQSTFENFDWIIAICDYNRARLEQLGCPPDKIVDLPNGIDTTLFSPGKGLSRSVINITTVARLHWIKNIPYAIRVMHRLAQAGLEFRYHVLGHGPDRSEIESLIDELGLSSRITLYGQCSQHEVAGILAESDLFFLPSRNEASPVCILEAQAAALPVLATRVGGIPELVIDGVNGHVVDSGDEEAAAEWILSLAKRPEKRQEMGKNGREKARNYHDSIKLLRRCTSLYGAVPRPAEARVANRTES